jgi:16S rRNA (guanine(527)-N(7))-methyltransferase RsmG
METSRLTELLQPFLQIPGSAEHPSLSEMQLGYISMYIDILLRWNARMNLTAVRRPEDVVTRHFGESLFAARHLFPGQAEGASKPDGRGDLTRVFDVGSGAGFPGLPIKIWVPNIELTLIESNHKKATFLREVVRSLALAKVNVFGGRAEDLTKETESAGSKLEVQEDGKRKDGRDASSEGARQTVADVVTLRAVERFDSALPIAASLVRSGGRLALLIGGRQVGRVSELTPGLEWNSPLSVPLSVARALLIGRKSQP